MELHARAAAVVGCADFLHGPLCDPAGEFLAVNCFIPRNLHRHHIGEGIDYGNSDAMQPARGCVCLVRELPTRVQGAQNHLQRRFPRVFRMLIHRNTASVINNHDFVIGLKMQLNPVGMPGHSLIHCIVQDLPHQMMQRALIRAANIHARTLADRF